MKSSGILPPSACSHARETFTLTCALPQGSAKFSGKIAWEKATSTYTHTSQEGNGVEVLTTSSFELSTTCSLSLERTSRPAKRTV